MSEEKIPVTDTVESNGEKAGIKEFIKKYTNIFYWIPVAISGLLGLVLLLAPIASMMTGKIAFMKINHLTGYDVFEYMSDLDYGFTIPVVLIIALGALSVCLAVISGVLKKFRQSIFCDMLTCTLCVLAFAIGTGQTAWLNAEYKAEVFSVLCLVFGLIFALLATAELIIHWVFIATQNDKMMWKATLNRNKAWLYLAPTIVLILVFTVWPIINTVRMSLLKDYNGMLAVGGKTFEFGLDNFSKVVKYKKFAQYLGTTMLLTVITVPVSTMLALLIAVALNSIKWVRKTMQTIFFLPYVTNAIAIGMVFNAMFTMILGTGTINDPNSVGLINNIIQAFGGKPINWVNEGSNYAANITVVAIYIVWNAFPFKILILLGGLQSVNKQYYDAAKIDGTSRARTFWRITVPMLSPMIAYVVITGFIGGFKEYSSIVGIFGDKMGPIDHEVDTMVGYIYTSLVNNQGTASAAALILFAIIFVVTMINLYVSKKKVHY